jgi:hypothetical protein
MDSHESEERLVLRKPLYESPGTTEHRGPKPAGVRARQAKMPGPSVRAERRAAEKKAEERNNRDLTPDDLFAMLAKEQAAKGRKQKNHMVDERPKVWQLGSWMEGDKPYPDEHLRWEA